MRSLTHDEFTYQVKGWPWGGLTEQWTLPDGRGPDKMVVLDEDALQIRNGRLAVRAATSLPGLQTPGPPRVQPRR